MLFRRFIISIASIFLFFWDIFACSLPPDIIHEFRLDVIPGKNLQIHYSLSAWGNLEGEIQKEIESVGGVESYLREHIREVSSLTIDGIPIEMSFLTGGLADTSTIDREVYSITQAPLIEGVYTTSLPSSVLERAKVELRFEKTLFREITPLIHPYIFSNIQKDGEEQSFIEWSDGNQYFTYLLGGTTYALRNTLKEWETENLFTLFISPPESLRTPLTGEKSDTQVPESKNTAWIFTLFTQVWQSLEVFFYERWNTYLRTLWLLLALLLGMGHALLPGHSKSLIATFIVSKDRVSPWQIAILIGSSAFSHTFFLFVLATLVLMLQKWLSHMAGYIVTLAALGYICFGAYFVKRGREMIAHTRHMSSQITCGCDERMRSRSPRRSIMTSGILAGMNPCIDALALFLLAISIGDALYALMMILAFSLGLGLMLGILAWIIGHGKRWLSKKSEKTSEKFSAYITFFSGIFIILLGSYTLIM